MPTCSFSYLAPVFQSVTRKSPQRLFRASTRLSSTLSLSSEIVDASPTPEHSAPLPQTYLRERKFHELQDSLTRGGGPSRVWAYYTDLLNVLGYDRLPLKVHQAVLRKCTPSSAELRVSAVRRLLAGNRPSNPHIHEGRFQTIIRNIRAIDQKPELDDYHFILDQFAAVGHYIGAMQVYKELTYTGITPRTKTFGLCLQAIAHRLTLPVARRFQSHRTTQARRMMADLITDMQELQIPFTPANLNLTIRILKETMDMETFENLMKWGYGIDLSNPDRPPLEYSGSPTIKSDLGMASSVVLGLPPPQQFTTVALNTTIDVLGSFGDVSKLVQAFEVLTQPLPRASEHLFSSFDDDDDFGVADPPKTPPFIPPHAYPNTTTYNMLLRHLCRAGHATLARHYLLEAMLLDRQGDSKLRYAICKHPLERVRAPHFAVNRGMLLSVFGECNRNKNINLMHWLFTKIPAILKRKKGSLKFFTEFKERWEKKRAKSHRSSRGQPPKSEPKSVENPKSAFLPSSSLPLSQRSSSLLTRNRPRKTQNNPIFDVDVDMPPTPPTQTPIKYIDIDLHLRVLERDIQEIESFFEHLQMVLGRTVQRHKERLGRRVWAGKDIYLSFENQRRKVGREEWQRIAGFKPRRLVDSHNRAPLMQSTAPDPSSRRFSTFFQSNQLAMREGVKELPQPESPPRGVLTHLSSMLHP